jgi:hypothetical protein
MARKSSVARVAAKRRFSTSQIILYIISLLVILSMAIGFVIDSLLTPASVPVTSGTPVATLTVEMPVQ